MNRALAAAVLLSLPAALAGAELRALGLVQADACPLTLSLRGARLTLEPGAAALLLGPEPGATVTALEPLRGTVRALAAGPCAEPLLAQAGLGVTPGPSPLTLAVPPSLAALTPRRPLLLTLGGPGARVTGPGGLPVRPLPSDGSLLFDGDHVLEGEPGLPDRPESEPQLELLAADPTPGAPPRVLLRAGTWHASSTDRLAVPIRSDDVYLDQTLPFVPGWLAVTLDARGEGERWAALEFPTPSKGAATRLRAGPAAVLRVATREGYALLVAPTAAVDVTAPGPGEEGTLVSLVRGAALVLPLPAAASPLAGDLPTVRFAADAGRVVKHGQASFLCRGADDEPWLPLLLEVAGRHERELELSRRLGAARAAAATVGATAAAHLDALRRLARAATPELPVFTPLARVPCRATDLLDGFAVHLDDLETEQVAFVEAGAAAEPPPEGAFSPSRLANLVALRGPDGSPGGAVHFFRSFLPGAAEDAARPGRRTISLYLFRSRSLDLSAPPRILRPEEVDAQKRFRDWLARQLQERPYRTACAVVFLLASLVYVLAKGPGEVARSLWRLLTFFRGEPCPRCGMPLEKHALPALPLDERLAAATALILAGGASALDEVNQAVTAAVAAAGDGAAPGARLKVTGDCIWCLRCNKGQVRFRLVEGGRERELGRHPVRLRQTLEVLRRVDQRAGPTS